ncbi:unnamed protein product [Caenorhabditis brenneri]
MSEDPVSDVKKPMEPSSILEAIFIFIGSFLFKAIEYLSAFTHSFQKSPTPPKSLSDMPVDVVGLIIERLDYKEQLRLRKVSKSFRSLVDSQKPPFKSIKVDCSEEVIEIKMNHLSVAFTSEADYRALKMRYDDMYYDDYDIMVIRDEYRKVAFDDLASILKNPKLQLDYFEIGFNFFDERDIESEEGFLKKISILLHSKTGEINWSTYSTEMDRVALLEQWKQAEVLELWYSLNRFPLEYTTHFKQFLIIENRIDGDNFIRIKDLFSKSANFEQCTLSCWEFSDDHISVYELLGAPVSSNATEEIFRHSIPDSDLYFEFTWLKGSEDVIIVKKKRENFPPKMSEISSSDGKKPMEKPSNDLTEAMGQLSVNSDKTSSTKNLSDMPVDVVSLIIERCEYMEQLKLRKVSKSLRELVDKEKPACESIQFHSYSCESTIRFDDYFVVYTDEYLEDLDQDAAYVIRDDFEEAALDDLASNLKNPKLQLKELSVYFVDGYKEGRDYDKLQCIFKSLNHQLSVGRAEFKLSTLSRLLSILPCFQPGVLKRISLDLLFDTDDDLGIDLTGMDQVALLDQWKQAEELELHYSFDIFPIEYAAHFKRFIIIEFIFDTDKITRIKDFLSKSENFEQCTLSWSKHHCYPDSHYQFLGAPVSSNTTKEVVRHPFIGLTYYLETTEEVFHHPITDSDDYFEFTWSTKTDDVIVVKKKKRETN